MTNPKYKHDCDKCIFLGHLFGYDMYMCPYQLVGPTFVLRYSSECSDYSSGYEFVSEKYFNCIVSQIGPDGQDAKIKYLVYREAVLRAVARGLLKVDELEKGIAETLENPVVLINLLPSS